MTAKNILIFSPFNPFSPEHGAHARVLQQIKGLKEGNAVYLASTQRYNDKVWPRQTAALAAGVNEVFVFERSLPGWCERLTRLPIRFMTSVLKRIGLAANVKHVRAKLYNHLLEYWFQKLVAEHAIDAVVINYTSWAALVQGVDSGVVKILELHDLAPISNFLHSQITQELSVRDGVVGLRPGYRQFNYVTQVQSLPDQARADLDRDIACQAWFDVVVSISDLETRIVRVELPDVVMETIYPENRTTLEVTARPDALADYALIPTGPNVFNTYSLLRYFDRVEKQVEYAAGARVEITGTTWNGHGYDLPARHAYLGLVDDYPGKLSASRFVIAPTLVGTGQQMKIFEALSYGVPVVCYRAAVPEWLRTAGVGLVAVEDDAEFARAVSRFWQDDEYCRDMRSQAAGFAKMPGQGFTFRDLAAKYIHAGTAGVGR